MVNVDEHTQNAIEIVAEGAKLTEQMLLSILKSLNEFLNNNKDNKDEIFSSSSTKDGQQKINELIQKHKSNVFALDENLTKRQLDDYKKEFKKLGVDFSVTKNGKDSYSFFFAGNQSNLIEKALKNVAELKSAVLSDDKVINAENDLRDTMKSFSKQTVTKVKELYDNQAQLSESIKGLSDEEKQLFDKYSAVDNVKEVVTNEVKKTLVFEEKIESDSDSTVPKKDMEVTKDEHNKDKIIASILNDLDKDERKLFFTLNSRHIEEFNNGKPNATNISNEQAKLYATLKDSTSKESVDKVENIFKDKVHIGLTKVPDNKVYISSIDKVRKQLEKAKEHDLFSVGGVKQKDTQIKQESINAPEKNRKQDLSR